MCGECAPGQQVAAAFDDPFSYCTCDRAIVRQRHSVTAQRSDLHSCHQYKKRLHSQALFVLMFDSAPTVWCVGVNLSRQVGVRWALLFCPERAITSTPPG